MYVLLKAEILRSGTSNPDAGFYIFNPESNRGFAVEGIATLLIQKMNGKRKLIDLVVELETEQGLNRGDHEKDILHFIEDLLSNDLIQTSEHEISAPAKA